MRITTIEEFYEATLQSHCERSLNYLLTRDLVSCKEQIGYCDSQVLENCEFSPELLEKQVLYSSGYSFFQDRIVFPIHDSYDKLIAVAGRAIEDIKPKYFNTVYEKRNLLFGLSRSKKRIVDENYCVIVEGYIDWYRLYLAQIPVVALSSAALLTEQYNLILRYTDRLILALDNDSAGARSVDKIKSLFCHDNDILIKSISFKEYKDPDLYIRNKGKESFIELYSHYLK